jgi:hypothetical protein
VSAKEWATPLVLGLVTAGVLWVAVPQGGDGGDGGSLGGHGGTDTATGTSTDGPPAIVLPFQDGTGPAQANLTFVVLAPRGQAAAMDLINRSFAPPRQAEGLSWQEPTLGLYTATVPTCRTAESPMLRCDPYWAFGPWVVPRVHEMDPASPGPRLGVDGHNGTRITVHVFDETGLLAATNAPEHETEAFRGRSTPEPLPGGIWYVGDSPTAPNGTRHVPSAARPLFEQLRPLMHGLPVGGVASVRSDAFASVYGVLYVTVRIDALVKAP